ncbi:uncharacterized protein N7498_003827 [Penicillium cinerascens]|uniref:DUF4219 domain-containing protein n=1 Tax=Penicillium cinerascens TaxID=70096 RepID=A0A9W9T7I3_9EURO|nr:uncharacterized protein N7498_003827 [Penicillium cinerascens]KAJ5212181.1 hypothetical protein N7498_003827 [Penicillium cinerascens]
MFRQSRRETANQGSVRKLQKRSNTGIFDHHHPSRKDWKSPERSIAKIRKDRRKNIGQIHDETDEERELTEKEWDIPYLRNWSFDVPRHSQELHAPNVEPDRTIGLGLQPGRQLSPGETSTCGSHRKSPTQGSYSWPSPPSRRIEQSAPSTVTETSLNMTEQHLARIPAPKVKRFYQERELDDKLTGPENYALWARDMRRKLTESNAWPIISQSLSPVPSDSCYHAQWARLNKQAWLLIISSISREIRRDLCDHFWWNTPGAWYYLQETYSSVPATTLCAMRGIGDLLNLKYEQCASMKDFLGLMVQYCHAIECNQEGKRGTEWLWCQFILMKLGPNWGGWVEDLIERIEGSDSELDSLVDMCRLVDDLLGEDEQRTLAEERRRATASNRKKSRFELA